MDLLNDILVCVSVALDALWPDYPVFTELVPDEMPERCFLLDFAGEVDVSLEISRRYKVSGKLDIAYYSPKRGDDSKKENNSMFLKMALNLLHLSFSGVQLRLEKHTKREVDDVLHDICAFETFILEQNPAPLMQEIKTNPTITV